MRWLFFIWIFCNLGVQLASAQTTLVVESAAEGIALNTIEKFPKKYASVEEALLQLPKLIEQLKKQGYWEASIDRWSHQNDTLKVFCWVGNYYPEISLHSDSLATQLLKKYPWKKEKKIQLESIDSLQSSILQYLSEQGYPFAKVLLEDLAWNDSPTVSLKIEPGPIYQFDSVINVGSAIVNYHYLAKYLQVDKGTLFQPSKVKEVNERLNNLDFVEQEAPPQVQLTGTGAILQLNLKERKTSQFDFLIGLLPATNDVLRQKLMITGEANILLKNEFGGGETLGLTWQQLQPKSPRLQILFDQPYVFKTNWGLNANFHLFKKDSSFVTIQMNAGIKYAMGMKQVGVFFIEQNTSNIIGLDTNLIQATKRLPDALDVRSTNIGLSHEYNGTDYLRNPRKGIYWTIAGTAGIKQVKENAVITQMKDPSFDYTSLYDTIQMKSYQLRVRAVLDKYFPIGKASTFKVSTKGGWYQSPQIFRNELFQIGGYKLLRGFDEESIYVSSYVVGTVEYRYLIGRNAYLFAFSDLGWVESQQVNAKFTNQFLSGGAGIFLETRAGVIQLALAAGKRNNQSFDLKQAKIHIGYVNYF